MRGTLVRRSAFQQSICL